MKYETPELTALTAINAIQDTPVGSKSLIFLPVDSQNINDGMAGYADWE